MSLADLAVIVVGAGLIAWEVWLFLGPRPSTGAIATPRDGVQELCITVRHGYHPNIVLVEAGRPVRLVFYRDETAEGSAQVVCDGIDIEQDLPAFHATAVTFTPHEPGDYPFRSRAGTLRGRVVAQVGRDAARVNLGKGHKKHG